MSNTCLIVICISVIIIVGHLYIKNMLIRNPIKSTFINKNKKVTFGLDSVKYIPKESNHTLNSVNSITPPDNIVIKECSLESELKNHIDSIYKPEKIVYDESFYKKDSLTGYSDNKHISFSQFKDNTDYYPYNKDDRELINKYNNFSSAHFTDDNVDISTFYDDNKQFNDTTSAFVDNCKYDKNELKRQDTLISPPLIKNENECQQYNTVLKNKKDYNKGLITNEIVDVSGEQLESWQYQDEKVINGGQITNGLHGFNGFNDEYSVIKNEDIDNCEQ